MCASDWSEIARLRELVDNRNAKIETLRAENENLRKELKEARERLVARETEFDLEMANRMYAETRNRMTIADKDGGLADAKRQLENLRKAWPHESTCSRGFCSFTCDCDRKKNYERARDGEAKD